MSKAVHERFNMNDYITRIQSLETALSDIKNYAEKESSYCSGPVVSKFKAIAKSCELTLNSLDYKIDQEAAEKIIIRYVTLAPNGLSATTLISILQDFKVTNAVAQMTLQNAVDKGTLKLGKSLHFFLGTLKVIPEEVIENDNRNIRAIKFTQKVQNLLYLLTPETSKELDGDVFCAITKAYAEANCADCGNPVIGRVIDNSSKIKNTTDKYGGDPDADARDARFGQQ